MQHRNKAIDIMKGIGILSVIIGHINDIPYMPIRHLIFTFHMPLFFLIAGYFHKPSNDIYTTIKGTASRLLIPYGATSTIMIIYSVFVAIETNNLIEIFKEFIASIYAAGDYHHSLLLGKIRPIGAIWFLPALFWCKIVYTYLQHRKVHLTIIILCSIIATYIDYYIINLPFAILPGISAMIFYMIGYYFKNNPVPKVVLLICILLWPLSYNYSHVYMVQCSYKIYPLAVIGACGGTLIIYSISNFISKHSIIIANLFNWLGQMSMPILCFHMIESLCHVYPTLGLPSNLLLQVSIRIIIPIIFTYICTKIKFTRNIFKIE